MSNVTERTSIVLLNSLFTGLYGSEWWRMEDETLSIDLALEFSPLMLAKIRLLKGLLSDARPVEDRIDDEGTFGIMDLADVPRISEDPILFMAANDVVNNQDPDGTVVVMPTVMELGYTLYVLNHLPIRFQPDTMTALLAEYVLHTEGVLRPFFPFVNPTNFPEARSERAHVQEAALREALGLYIIEMEAA